MLKWFKNFVICEILYTFAMCLRNGVINVLRFIDYGRENDR